MAISASQLQFVTERIAAAAHRAGRSPEEVTLVAVSKRKTAEDIHAAFSLGQTAIGENYVQEMLAKQDDPLLTGLAIAWHYIGPLQRNKVRHVVGRVALLHAVDSPRLLDEIERRSAAAELRTPLLLQVNLSGEETKSGCTADALPALAEHALGLPHVELRGLMTMPAPTPDPEQVRPDLRHLRELRDELAAAHPEAGITELSMGMSADYEVAVEEGATLVRVGSLLFGARE